MATKNINAKGIIAHDIQLEQIKRLVKEWHKNDGTNKFNSFGIIGKFFEPLATIALRNWVLPKEIARASKQGQADAFFTKKGMRYTVEIKTSLQATFAQDNTFTGVSAEQALKDLCNNDFIVFDTKNIMQDYDYASAVNRLLENPFDYDFSTVYVAPCKAFIDCLLQNGLIYYTATKRANLFKGVNVFGKNSKGENAVLNKKKYVLLWQVINDNSVPFETFLKWRKGYTNNPF